ncbi:glutamate ABC transporter substrate-binding protein [Rhodococcoides fascians]|uniref:glutamate ABC transporter substrate-binding protein n=1 Tax=Rhodococcoides fascians TaxID=1828 RepID=UPI0005638D2F|nr:MULTISPECIES: glutamate ABC transporter substrate-binding protein [Rhodococcus]OZE99420.1 ABC transporter substrate-binding protein [Rhodococcus sp. 15-1189-1-1a]OZF13711.1 ABC transporter substrate-binding protein [Rhodococcus sp. 14-2686-1-2]
MNRTLLVVAAILVGLLTTSCVAPEALPPEPDISYTEPPMPDGAGPATDAPEVDSPDPQCARPTASLRPIQFGSGQFGSGQSGPAPESTPPSPTVDQIRERGRLIVGLDTGSNLFSFRDPMTGKLVGFDVDIAREISRDLFGDPDRVDFRILTSAERIEALQNSTVDVVVKTMTITCARKQEVSFSTVYFQAQHRVLAVKNSGINGVADLANRRVCAVDGTTSLRRLQRIVPTAQITTAAMWSDCLVVLQQRQVDAISTDDTILAGLAAQDPYLELVGESLSPEPYGVGIKKESEDLVRFVNGTLERIRGDGTWNRLYNRWLSVLGSSPGPPFPQYVD